MSVLLAFLSLLLELASAIPTGCCAAIGHPVIWIGSLISSLDRTLNRATESDRSASPLRRRCALVAASSASPPAIAGSLECAALALSRSGSAVLAIAGSTLLAQRAWPSTSRRSPTRWKRAASRPAARPSRRSSAAIRSSSTRPASAAPRSRAWPRTFPTASSRRPSGWRSAGWPAASPTRPPTPPIP